MIPKRITWMAVGGALTVVARSRAERAVADEARRLPDRLPAPAARLVRHLPPEVVHVAGAAIVAGRTAGSGGRTGYRGVVIGSRTMVAAGGAIAGAARLAARGAAAASDATARARQEARAVQSMWAAAAAAEERQLRAELARLNGDETEAVDALLDRRRPTPAGGPPPTPPPVPAGRPRPRLPDARPAVGRVQRTYLPPARP